MRNFEKDVEGLYVAVDRGIYDKMSELLSNGASLEYSLLVIDAVLVKTRLKLITCNAETLIAGGNNA